MLKRRYSVEAITAVALLIGAIAPTSGSAEHLLVPVKPLARFVKLDRSEVTVSGISSGAFFAHQFHVAYSGLVKGAGLVAGGPYACAEQVNDVVPPLASLFTGI